MFNFIFQGHEEFNKVEAVGMQIFDEARVPRECSPINMELGGDDFKHDSLNVARFAHPAPVSSRGARCLRLC